MVAYHFPPCGEVSGTLRTLSMARGLRGAGWDPIILVPTLAAYPRRDASLMPETEFAGRVFRAFALDAKRHLGLFGHYPARLARPDRWASWRFAGVRLGLELIRRFQPEAIWSTYPIASAHGIAVRLQSRSGLPWVADFRDPMLYDAKSGDDGRSGLIELERRIVRQASACVFVTECARECYQKRYAGLSRTSFEHIPNGYDESVLLARRAVAGEHGGTRTGCLRLLHSGALYPEGRSPKSLFRVLAALRAAGGLAPHSVQVILRGSLDAGEQRDYAALLRSHDLADVVRFAPALPRAEALHEQLEVDGLLLLQGSRFNAQIPAKVYEYLGLGKPIFALTDPRGETARVLSSGPAATVTDAANTTEAAARLGEFLRRVATARGQPLPAPPPHHARSEGARRLAALLERIARSEP
ncbi:glycosyltransferase [Acidihalobacter ferrooxydans]|nr:glycosyltransferase [Acidihalobacter ferrooxydans]